MNATAAWFEVSKNIRNPDTSRAEEGTRKLQAQKDANERNRKAAQADARAKAAKKAKEAEEKKRQAKIKAEEEKRQAKIKEQSDSKRKEQELWEKEQEEERAKIDAKIDREVARREKRNTKTRNIQADAERAHVVHPIVQDTLSVASKPLGALGRGAQAAGKKGLEALSRLKEPSMPRGGDVSHGERLNQLRGKKNKTIADRLEMMRIHSGAGATRDAKGNPLDTDKSKAHWFRAMRMRDPVTQQVDTQGVPTLEGKEDAIRERETQSITGGKRTLEDDEKAKLNRKVGSQLDEHLAPTTKEGKEKQRQRVINLLNRRKKAYEAGEGTFSDQSSRKLVALEKEIEDERQEKLKVADREARETQRTQAATKEGQQAEQDKQAQELQLIQVLERLQTTLEAGKAAKEKEDAENANVGN